MAEVTVIIPAYNRPNDLRQALYSLAAQTKQDFSVIVADDASTENLKEICDEFPQLNINYLRSNKNRGCGGNRRFALEYFLGSAPTEYLMWLDSDDFLLPFAIERLTTVIAHNKADIIVTNIWRDYSLTGEKNIIAADQSRTWLHGKIYRTQFLIDHNITFPISMRTNEDLAFNLSLYAYDPESYLLNEEIYYFRNNPSSTTKNSDNWKKCSSIDYIDAIYYAYEHYMKQKHVLDTVMIATIIALYNYYQRGIIFGTLDEQHKQKVRKMIRNHQVELVLVSIYAHPEIDFPLDQWTRYDENLVFFGQSFGSWLMTFFKPADIQALIKENGLQQK